MPTDVEHIFTTYPQDVQTQMRCLRALVLRVAEKHNLGHVEENLKWGEPSFSVPSGSPVRMHWKSKQSDQIGIYFHCQTRLVETFRALYQDDLSFNGNRAILLDRYQALPLAELEHCVLLAFKYHQLKHLPLLGE